MGKVAAGKKTRHGPSKADIDAQASAFRAHLGVCVCLRHAGEHRVRSPPCGTCVRGNDVFPLVQRVQPSRSLLRPAVSGMLFKVIPGGNE